MLLFYIDMLSWPVFSIFKLATIEFPGTFDISMAQVFPKSWSCACQVESFFELGMLIIKKLGMIFGIKRTVKTICCFFFIFGPSTSAFV